MSNQMINKSKKRLSIKLAADEEIRTGYAGVGTLKDGFFWLASGDNLEPLTPQLLREKMIEYADAIESMENFLRLHETGEKDEGKYL